MASHKKAAKKVELAERRLKEIVMFSQGYNMKEIAKAMGIHASTVQVDIQKVTELWTKQAKSTVRSHIGRILAEIAVMKVNLWEAWRLSQQVRKRIIKEGTGKLKEDRKDLDKKYAQPDDFKYELEKVKYIMEESYGDVTIMNTILQCIEKECKLLKLFSNEKQVINVDNSKTNTIGILSLPENATIYNQILVDAAGGQTPDGVRFAFGSSDIRRLPTIGGNGGAAKTEPPDPKHLHPGPSSSPDQSSNP